MISNKKPTEEKTTLVPLDELHDRDDHPIKQRFDASLLELIDSVARSGVLVPGIVRPLPKGGYEIISGRRRKLACEAAGLEVMPVIVRDLDDDQAIIEMVDSNIQRETISPVDRGMAYKMKLEAVKRLETRNELCSLHSVEGADSVSEEADDVFNKAFGDNASQAQKYIRLTELIPELRDMVDNGTIGFTPAVELSYLMPDEQELMVLTIETEETSPSVQQARKIKKLSLEGELTDDSMLAVMCEHSRSCFYKLTLKGTSLRKYFSPDYTPREIEQIIYRLLEQWSGKTQRAA